ncbi:phosphotransferase [Spongiactinospora gelatinilytica]|uniref:phosphotransferase n=1 Tax=Spongiactinospora gelatinilytica TaxID=2666298 RepID=UPI001314C814|nr:phosphotransferase [Spongiactinospora gelatinilytica]
MTTWQDLPRRLREDAQTDLGRVHTAIPLPTGAPWTAALLHTKYGCYYLKACPALEPAALSAVREQWAAAVIPSPPVPTPSLVWSSNDHGWATMIFEYIDGRHPDLTPGSPDIPAVTETLNVLAEDMSPYNDRSIPPVSESIYRLLLSSQVMLNDPELPDWELYDAALDFGRGLKPAALDCGDMLLHGDLRRSKLLFADGEDGEQVYVLDWSRIARGAAFIEPVMFALRLIQAGHSPQQAEMLLMGVFTWDDAPPDQVTALIATWTLHNLHAARYGPDETRNTRSAAAQEGRSWLHHRFAPLL